MQEILFYLTEFKKRIGKAKGGKRGGITRPRNPRSGVYLGRVVDITSTNRQRRKLPLQFAATFEYIKPPLSVEGFAFVPLAEL